MQTAKHFLTNCRHIFFGLLVLGSASKVQIVGKSLLGQFHLGENIGACLLSEQPFIFKMQN